MRISDWSSDVCSSDLTSQWGITTASAQGRRYAMGDTTDGWRPAAPWGTMALFLSTYVNRIDKKGRVSVPESFRAALEASGSSSEERRVGQEGVSKCRYRGSPFH